MTSKDIYVRVSEFYSSAIETHSVQADVIAKAFGYSAEDLESIPKEANLGLSCGNPLAVATLREGETVIDLGSGAGLDVFLAAGKVGSTGTAIGVDMNKDMLSKAQKLKDDSGKTNVKFVESYITDIALESEIADCIISNCVINLVPEAEKQLAFNEMYRLLKPGGRLSISDILAKAPLPKDIKEAMDLFVGCIAGASQVSDYERYLRNAGFNSIFITDSGGDLNVYLGPEEDQTCCSAASSHAEVSCSRIQVALQSLKGQDLNQFAGSFRIYGVKL